MPKRYSVLAEYPKAYEVCRRTGHHNWSDDKPGAVVTDVLSKYTNGVTKQFRELLYCANGCGTLRDSTYENIPKHRRLRLLERKLKNPSDYKQPAEMKGIEAPREVWQYELSLDAFPGIRLE